MNDRTDSLAEILKDYNNILDKDELSQKEIKSIRESVARQISIYDNTKIILDNATDEFNKLTSIFNKKDLSFFVFSLILQGAVKFAMKAMRDMSDKELAKKTPFHGKEHSCRANDEYYCTRAEICANPVPFDAMRRAFDKDIYEGLVGGLPGFNGFNHRTKALGHDPILGLIFGTANIMTSTITRNDFRSWHVKSHVHNVHHNPLDSISTPASTIRIFSSIGNRLSSEGKEGWMTLGCALLKEIIHLLSDIPSRQSLPLPIVPAFSEELAKELALYGLNFGTIVQGGMALMVINWLIGFLHGLCRTDKEDKRLYEARTRKIIAYSNTLSTVSDIGYSMFLAMSGDKNAMRKFDLGGYLITLYQISNCSKVISEIETEFYINKINIATLSAL